MESNKNNIKIKGYIARDKNNELHFFNEKPYREHPVLWWKTKNEVQDMLYIDSDIFPELKWEDEPIQVELFIKKT